MSGWGRLGRGRWTSYDAVRVALGLLLLVAAALKGYHLATTPLLGHGVLNSRWLLVGVVECEFLFALWLLADLSPQTTRLAAIGCFGVFALVSLYKAFSGEVSCGCFGHVAVNPWITFGLDAMAVLSLTAFRLGDSRPMDGVGKRCRVRRYAVVGVLWLLLGIPAALMMNLRQANGAASAMFIAPDARIVVLEPQGWIGNRFPLLEHIDVGERIARGSWTVVLYHHDCPRCQDLLGRLDSKPGSHIHDTPRPMALVEMPPYRPLSLPRTSSTLRIRGRLKNVKRWFVETPVLVRLDEGMVTAVLQEQGDVLVRRSPG